MSTTIVMPKAGLTMVEGTISQWLVAEGAYVKKGDALMEYENEKNTIECDALADGYVHILAQEGDTIPVGEPIGILAESPEELAALSGTAAPAKAPAAPAAPAPAAASAEGVVEIPMPRAGLTMVEGTIAQWKVSEGAEVAKGDVVMEFENEKNTIDYEIVHGGFLHIVAAEGETVKVGDPIAYVAETKAAYDALVSGGAPAPAVEKGCVRECPTCVHTAAPAAAAPAVSSAVRTDGHIRASGLAKKMAKEAGIDIRLSAPAAETAPASSRGISPPIWKPGRTPPPRRLLPPDLRTRSPRSPGWA